jgi:hypothetical protein
LPRNLAPKAGLRGASLCALGSNFQNFGGRILEYGSHLLEHGSKKRHDLENDSSSGRLGYRDRHRSRICLMSSARMRVISAPIAFASTAEPYDKNPILVTRDTPLQAEVQSFYR